MGANDMHSYRNERTGEVRQVGAEELQDGDRHLLSQGFTRQAPAAKEPKASAPAKAVVTNVPPKAPKAEAETETEDYEDMTVSALRDEAEKRGLEVKRGRGEEGAPLKEDYVKALKRNDKRPD